MNTHVGIHGVDNIEIPALPGTVGLTIRVNSLFGGHTDLDIFPCETHGFNATNKGDAVIAMLEAAIAEYKAEKRKQLGDETVEELLERARQLQEMGAK